MATSLLTVFCALSNSPTPPPGISIQEMYISLYNIDRERCPPVRDYEVRFFLYTRNAKEKPLPLKIDDDNLLNESKMDLNKSTKIFFHGFLESYLSKDAQELKDAYLQKEDCQVILVDAKILYAGLNYITGADNVQAVGKYSAKFVDYLITKGLNLDKFEVIGMSLGGQTTGILGGNVKNGKIKKIVAFDPAGPLFNLKPTDERLDAGDAEQVIVIHTSPHTFGYAESCGTTDIWVNKKPLIQPACDPVSVTLRNPLSIGELVFCSHWLSYRLGIYSINHPEAFPASKCEDKNLKNCTGNQIYLGDQISPQATGNYVVNLGADVYKTTNIGSL